MVHSTIGSTVHAMPLNSLGFEPGTSRLQAPIDTNEPPGPARRVRVETNLVAVTSRMAAVPCLM